jgi:type IV pilus assembly protein PilO
MVRSRLPVRLLRRPEVLQQRLSKAKETVMATRKSAPKVDVGDALRRFSEQFKGLNPNDPSVWPAVPRYLLSVAVTALVLVALWFVWLTNSNDELEAEQQYVTLLEKQLPSKAEMDALLSDINQAGLGRSLQFELFRPGQVAIRDYYAELPIAVRVSGKYHDMGAFVADVANLSRIVTLNNLSITPQKDGALTMDATARTYRYLDEAEQATQRRAAASGAKKK